MNANSKRRRSGGKATCRPKPRPDFPLYAHKVGRWAKKVRGKTVYFTRVADDPEGEKALEKWLDQKDDLLAGRVPRADRQDVVTVKDICDLFAEHKEALRDSGEITGQTYKEYYRTCQRLVDSLGRLRPVDDLRPDDFARIRAKLSDDLGLIRVGNEVGRMRSVFRFATDSGLLTKPVAFGAFRKPSAKALRIARAKAGPKTFTAAEIRSIIDAAPQPFKAMLHLGINAGFGCTDCASLPRRALDLDGGWIDFPRPKTGIPRKVPLWPETVTSIREAIATRKPPASDEAASLVFLTGRGNPFHHWKISAPVTKIIKDLKLHRDGLGFYTLRHVFQTIGEGCRDVIAVRAVMGHAPPTNDMSAIYREEVADDRLRAVADHVRAWLFGAEASK